MRKKRERLRERGVGKEGKSVVWGARLRLKIVSEKKKVVVLPARKKKGPFWSRILHSALFFVSRFPRQKAIINLEVVFNILQLLQISSY